MITLWDVATDSVITQQTRTDGIQALNWSPDGQVLVSCGDAEVCVWNADLSERRSFRPCGLRQPLRINDLAIAPTAEAVAIAEGHYVTVWDITSGDNIARFDAHNALVHSVKFSSDTMLVSAGRDNAVRVWELTTLREKRVLRGHSAYVWWLAGPTVKGQFASGGLDRRALLWNSEATNKADSIAFAANGVGDIALSPDDSILAAILKDEPPKPTKSRHNRVVLVGAGDLVQKKEVVVDYFVRSLAISSQGVLAVGGTGPRSQGLGSLGRITLWQSLLDDAPKESKELPSHVVTIQFSPDGRYLAAACTRDCFLLDLSSGSRRLLSAGGRALHGLNWSSDSRLVAAGTSWLEYDTPRVFVWDAQTGAEKFNSRGADDHTEGVHCVAFSPDGRLLASGGGNGHIHVHEVATGKLVKIIKAHSGFVWSITFSQDGRTLISGSGDDTINIWDLERNELRLSFPAHVDGTASLALSRDETCLFSSGLWDGTIRAWHAPVAADN